MAGEWALPEEMADRLPPSNNCILGHVIHRLVEKSLPPQVESTVPELPSFAIKGCILGKTFSGKTTVLKFLQKDFPIRVLSIDTLLQEAIRAFHDQETVHEALPTQSEAKGKAGPDLRGDESQDPQNKLSAVSVLYETLPEREDKTTLSIDSSKTPEAEEVKSNDSFSKLTERAQLGAKSEKMLKKGKSVSDLLLVNILINAINQLPVDQGWVLDGFPMTLNQARLLDEALTGCNRTLVELERKKAQKHALAVDPAATKEVPLPPTALDFVMLLDISDNSSLDRMNKVMAKKFPIKTVHEDINQRVAAKNQDTNDDQNLKDQIQHRITGFLDNWSLLQQWFSEPENILIKINAEIRKESLCQKVKEIFMNEMVKKENQVKKKLEEKEAERKKEASLAEPPALSPPLPPPESEKEKEPYPLHEPSKTPPAKGKPPSEPLHGKKESPQEGKGKKGETSVKKKGAADKGSPKGKSSGGKVPGKKSPAESTVAPPAPAGPPPPKPGSEEWVYVNEPIPEEIPSFLVPYWELIENSYIDSVKTVLRNLREDWHVVVTFLYEIRTSFQQFLRRPDHKQDFVSQWQADFNSIPEDLWDDEETKAEVHQRVNDLRDRLWDICDTRKEEAEQERLDIINKSWLQDSIGIMMNHFFSLMEAELNRFQDTKRFLQDYYRAMECKIPMEDKKFTHIPLLQPDSKDASESHLRIPLASRISVSPDSAVSKSKPKTILKFKIDHSLEKVELNLEADEKLMMDTWQQASLAISHMVAAEIHQRLLEEEKETQPTETKEKPPQMNANKKVTKEQLTQKKADKKEKGKSPSVVEHTPAVQSLAEIAEMEKKNELRLKIKEEHLAALQFEEIATQFRLELIKTKALAAIEDLVTKVVNVYKLMEKWLGERYLREMASVEKLTEVARYHIEMSTKIQNQLYLDQEDFFINGDIKVFPDPPPPIRPLPVEKEENGTLTIEQLDNFRDQFLEIAPEGEGGSDTSRRRAEGLLEILLRADVVKFVHFLVDVIPVLSVLNHVSQSSSSSKADVFATLTSTLEMLRMYRTRPGPKERRVDSVTHFQGNCLKDKGSISDVRNMVLTRLIKRLQVYFRDASQDVVKATVIGSFKLWPTKKNEGIIGNKAFIDILLDLVTLSLGTNNLPSSWMHLSRPELQELTTLLTVNSDFVDWRKFLLVASLPWPIALEEELLETLQRFKAVDEEQSGTITFQQYMQAGLWFTGHEDIKIPKDPFEPLPFNRQRHLIEFFFRLFADFEKDPPLLDYTWMLLYFACHPDPVEGVYRALSVATGTPIFQPIETATVIAEENYSFTDMYPMQEYPETEGNVISEKRELRGEREAKEEETPADANTEKVSIETLLQVFRGGDEGQGANQPTSALRRQNIYAENFIKVFQDLGAKNLEPMEIALLLKHPFIQDLISSYPDYKIPDIKIILQRSEHVQGSDEERSPSRFMEEKK